jgi:hypothetical protein
LKLLVILTLYELLYNTVRKLGMACFGVNIFMYPADDGINVDSNTIVVVVVIARNDKIVF